MNNTMKWTLIVAALVLAAWFFFIRKPAAAPSSTEQIPDGARNTGGATWGQGGPGPWPVTPGRIVIRPAGLGTKTTYKPPMD